MSDPNLTCEICLRENSVTHQVIKTDLTNYRKCCPKCEVLASRWLNKQMWAQARTTIGISNMSSKICSACQKEITGKSWFDEMTDEYFCEDCIDKQPIKDY